MFKSYVFHKPFGTIVSITEELAGHYADYVRNVDLLDLKSHLSLWYTLADFSRRGCIWYDGKSFGSYFHNSVNHFDFLPRFKSRYANVEPFVIYGFFYHCATFCRFVPLDIPLWKDRELHNILYKDRERILRYTLANLVENQSQTFLKEQRIELPTFRSFPDTLRSREHLLSTVREDVFLVDVESWQSWCANWSE